MLKRCSTCKKLKDSGEYYKSRNANGLQSCCIECSKNYAKEYVKKHKKECAIRWKKYRKKFKKQRKEYGKIWKQTLKGRYGNYRCGAKTRRINWDLTLKEFEYFWQKPCYYCGEDIVTIGLDRIDNQKGYSPNNVVSCCRICNKLKRGWTQFEFFRQCRKIANHQK